MPKQSVPPPAERPPATRLATPSPPLLRSACSAVALCLVTGGSTLEASPESRRLTREAYDLAYDLRFTDSLALLSRARAVDPADSAPVRAVAAVSWVQILCAQG